MSTFANSMQSPAGLPEGVDVDGALVKIADHLKITEYLMRRIISLAGDDGDPCLALREHYRDVCRASQRFYAFRTEHLPRTDAPIA